MKPSYALVAVLALCVSCNKDKDVPITKENIAGTYTFAKITFKPDGGGNEKDITNDMLINCNKDDLQIFEANGNYTYDDAGVQCGAGDELGLWNLNSTTSISIDGTAYDLLSFNGTVMVVGQAYDHLGEDGVLKTHLKKQ